MNILAFCVVFLPLISFFFAGIIGEKLGDRFSQWVTCSFMGLSMIFAVFLFFKMGFQRETLLIFLFNWIHVEFLEVSWGLQIDSLSLVMMGVVTCVSFTVHVYSIGYMRGDPGIPRFMSYLSLFTFFMLVLVTAPNLLQMFFGWEGVGLCSYLLIGYWYDREAANAAAIKAFLVNRMGDIGFVLGILTVFIIFGTVDFGAIFEFVEEHQNDTFVFLSMPFHSLTLITILLFIGAMGKSAQIGLHTWLPDAMEGPTPVSALIHAATMVTAGVFMVVRMSPLLEYAPLAREFITMVGAATALMAATIACVQNDIKRIIAYSTCSQLGYMFMAVGLSGYSASMFHLTTHAFFKALLFLGAGSVIHAMSDEQNIQKMGGIWKFIPVTYIIMWIGSLALAGIPFFAGFYSKDIILEINWVSQLSIGKVAFVFGLAAAILTAFYSWRLILLTFHGKSRADEAVMSHIHESPLVMLFPLFVLAIGSIFSGYLLYDLFVGEKSLFWGPAIFVLPKDNVLHAAHHVNGWIHWSPTLAASLGMALAYILYHFMKTWPERLSTYFKRVYVFLLKKWYFDEVYDRLFVNPSLKLGKLLWEEGDKEIIDGLGPNGFASLSLAGGRLLCALQTGYVYHYAFAMIIGLVLMISWYYWLY
ncbi:MAG: NADH-quinone oxidoreductase subunit L [Alphaproteobacteria bacterium]|nr:NADH-quinone oxidoreductase subunit L [Alphaproteobacteria bacterium]